MPRKDGSAKTRSCLLEENEAAAIDLLCESAECTVSSVVADMVRFAVSHGYLGECWRRYGIPLSEGDKIEKAFKGGK